MPLSGVNEDLTFIAGTVPIADVYAIVPRPAAVGPSGQGRGGQGAGEGKGKGAQAAAAQHGAVAVGQIGEGVTVLFQHGEAPGRMDDARQKAAPRTGDGLRTGQREDGKAESRPARYGGQAAVETAARAMRARAEKKASE